MSIAWSYQLSQRLSEYELAAAHLLFLNTPRGAKCKVLKKSLVIASLLIILALVAFNLGFFLLHTFIAQKHQRVCVCAFSIARKALLTQSVCVCVCVLLERKVAHCFSLFPCHSRSLKTYRPVLQLQCFAAPIWECGRATDIEIERARKSSCSLGIRSSDEWPFVTLP